jgi:hypothetical protein
LREKIACPANLQALAATGLEAPFKAKSFTGEAGLCAIEEEPHAQSLGALSSYKPHLAADVVGVFERGQLGLVVRRAAFQPLDALFYGAPESRTDFEAVLCCAPEVHREFPGRRTLRKNLRATLKFVSTAPILGKNARTRQITRTQNFGHGCVPKCDRGEGSPRPASFLLA